MSSDEPSHPPQGRHPDRHPGFPIDPDVTADDVRRGPGPAVRLLVERRDILLAIAAGGALGAVARWGLVEALPHDPDQLPWATVLANLSGCFAIGVLLAVLAERRPDSRLLRPLLGTGVLGGYTTFSTYALDTRDLLAAGRPALAAAYLFGTLLAGLLAVVAAIRLTERWLR
ncbi:fluoride efflux transporter CrcB [Nocardioides cynanchi]|uniref:fluoride efflux transporter CrcB n=1 Tax=Nocardioides cynanchi TaxID=2558918 RepID=UPI001EE2D36E|nr:fluoride efflux transporter CrcB [Nocardioides cynanchi]